MRLLIAPFDVALRSWGVHDLLYDAVTWQMVGQGGSGGQHLP